jgi:hypothetical protein
MIIIDGKDCLEEINPIMGVNINLLVLFYKFKHQKHQGCMFFVYIDEIRNRVNIE